MCCRLFILIPFLFWSADHYGQSPPANPISNLLYVQSANFEDMKAWAGKVSRNASALKIDPFKTVLAQHNDVQNGTYEDLRVDVVMYDPFRIGSRMLKKPNPMTADEYIRSWNERVTGDRILFFFQKPARDADDYDFKRLAASPELANKQLPEIITTYIEKNILAKAGNAQETLKAGINALKNAFDQQFKQRLIDSSPELAALKEFYKGIANIPYNYFYFEAFEDSTYKFSPPIYFKNEISKYTELHVHIFESFKIADFPASTLNIYNKDSIYFNLNNLDINLPINRYPNPIFILKNNNTYEHFFYRFINLVYPSYELAIKNKNLNKYLANLEQNENIVTCLYSEINKKVNIDTLGPKTEYSRIKVYSGTVRKGDNITPYLGWSQYSSFTLNQPTWCNVFAFELSKRIFQNQKDPFTHDFPVPYGSDGKSANQINNFFNEAKNTVYIEIENSKQNIDLVWKLINCGYSMYFSLADNPGHIETGFPDGLPNFGNRKTFDINFTKINYINQNSLTKHTCIGAGGYIGLKSYDKYFFLQKCQIFLYLGYLRSNF